MKIFSNSNLFICVLIAMLFIGCKDSVLSDEKLAEFSADVKKEEIRSHIAALAHDSLKGRLPGTTEYDIAMAYVADRFKEMGVKPLGNAEGTSYYQTLTLRNSVVDDSQSYMLLNGDSLKVGTDYFFAGNANVTKSDFAGELVLVGYGIHAPEYGFDDFKDVDVKGKIAVVFGGAPGNLPASERAYLSNTNTKIETLDQQGAQGILFASPPGGRGNFSGSYARFSQRGINSVVMPDGTALGRSNFGKNMKFGGYLNWTLITELTGMTVDDWKAYSEQGAAIKQSQDPIELVGKVVTRFTELESSNVVGVLEGDELKDEYIVHTAHLDHVGIGRPIAGDSIYNGAHDNASGISAMIEIARLYSKLHSKPRRSVIFAAVTAEEMGLLGSKYLAVNPPVDQDKIIANVNTDMPTLIAPMLSVEPLGAEQSSIMSLVERSTKQLNLRIDPDHMPEQVRFVRSDNLNFVLEGIPALRMKYGLLTEDSETGLDSLINDFTRNHYHKPSDELNDSFNFDAAKTYVRLQFMNSYLINVADDSPIWNEDSFFRKFKK